MANTDPHVPIMEYSVKINGKISESGKDKVSFNENYNVAAITYKCTNQSINRYQVWVTYVPDYPSDVIHGEDWGREVGNCALDSAISLAANTENTSTILVNKTIFSKGDGLYRLALCARGDLDYTWDVTVLYFALGISSEEAEMIMTSNGEAFEVIENQQETVGILGKGVIGYFVIGSN